MILGADTLVPVTESIVAMVRKRFGTAPVFWGRYFKRPGFEQDYQPRLENDVFTRNQIRLLPIAIDCLFEGGVDFDMVTLASALLNRPVFPG